MSTENEYSRAALALVNYVTRKHVTFETPEEIILQARQEFQERFSPEKLASLPDSVLLDTIFLSAKSNNESLCYHLEFNPKYKQFFGSISGGSSYKFGLFQKQDNMNWMTGSPQNPRVLSPEDALLLGKKIRDALIKGYNILASSTLETVDDYDVLDGKMSSELGQYASYAWFQKYFFMFFPSKLVGWYTIDWIRHYLYGLGIVPKENYYSINGQLAIIKGLTGLPDHHFQELCNKVFGEKRRFYRLTSSDEKTSYADDWRSRGMVAIGWNKLSDLIDYVKNGVLDRTRLTSKMESAYYQGDSRLATRKTAEIKSFFESKADDIIIVSDGDRLIGLVDKLSPYFYDPAEPMSHCKKGTWHSVFADTDRLPIDEGLKSACHEIQKAENLIYLYGKYFNLYERFAPTMTQQILSEADGIGSLAANTLPNRLPRTSKKHSLNTILYGAPGTGKTYSTAEYAMAIIEDADLNETLSTQEARKVLVLKYKGKMFLLNQTSSYKINTHDSFCFLFPTDYLFEGFISGFMQSALGDLAKVRLQASEVALVNDIIIEERSYGNAFIMRHDILVEHKDKGLFILDTKYKEISRLKGSSDAIQSLTTEAKQPDLYQMFTYAIKRDLKDVYLLYPMYRLEDEKDVTPTMLIPFSIDGVGHCLTVHIIRLPFIFEENLGRTKERLTSIIMDIFV